MKHIRNWKLSLPIFGVAVLGLAWLAFGYFGIHTAFIDDKVAEAEPIFDAPATPAAVVPDAGEPVEVEQVAVESDVASPDEAAPDAAAAESDTVEAEAVESEAVEPDAPAAGEIVTEYSGNFSGTSRYSVSGEALVLGNGTDQRFLRFENFESSNGPDLNVYLVNPDDPSDFVDLGDLKGNIGDQNYEIPATVDLDRYSQVSIWCVRFGVGFGSADLVPAA